MAHYYYPDGTLLAYVPNKSKPGTMREATLKDARPLGLYPSATTIMQSIAKPNLVDWKIIQAIQAAHKLGIPAEVTDDWVEEVVRLSEEYSRQSQDLGTQAHNAVSAVIRNEPVPDENPMRSVAYEVVDWMLDKGYTLDSSELSFVNPYKGWAGTIDIIGTHYGKTCVIDLKTQDFDNPKRAVFREEYPLQLAAYDMGAELNSEERISVIASRTHPGVVAEKVWDRYPETDQAFENLAALWRWQHKYDPRLKGRI